ncbi:uncharacterized protein N7511_009785 [Penicillium nucicola]|uniref:uncharacterized protein n=1 Tax=Penicillium nucicola TaxID=1850975 RepID=UPI002544E048|nr:uncharacterized protein N7511_009785 [Penicillium nucicola]KAJ5748089.1 hypothetical protein N7511_009785 [Penicillium nucicola]
MKFNIIALAALLTTAAAQGLGDLPDCSKECATGAIPQSCGIDFKCICEAKSFLNDVTCCVAQKCSKADQETTLKVAKSICARGGVTNLPDEVTCSSSSSSSSSSSTSTGTKTGTNASASTSSSTSTSTGSTTSSASDVSATNASSTSSKTSSASSASAAATSTGAAMAARKDSSLVAAAGAAAAFAILI